MFSMAIRTFIVLGMMQFGLSTQVVAKSSTITMTKQVAIGDQLTHASTVVFAHSKQKIGLTGKTNHANLGIKTKKYSGNKSSESLILKIAKGYEEHITGEFCNALGKCKDAVIDKIKSNKFNIKIDNSLLEVKFFGNPCRSGDTCEIKLSSWYLNNILENNQGITQLPNIVTIIDKKGEISLLDFLNNREFLKIAKSNKIKALGKLKSSKVVFDHLLKLKFSKGDLLLDFENDRAFIADHGEFSLSSFGLGNQEDSSYVPMVDNSGLIAKKLVRITTDKQIIFSNAICKFDKDSQKQTFISDCVKANGDILSSQENQNKIAVLIKSNNYIRSHLLQKNNHLSQSILFQTNYQSGTSYHLANTQGHIRTVGSKGVFVFDGTEKKNSSLARKIADYRIGDQGHMVVKEKNDKTCNWDLYTADTNSATSFTNKGSLSCSGSIDLSSGGSFTSITTLNKNVINILLLQND